VPNEALDALDPAAGDAASPRSHAQRLRLRRVLWGATAWGWTALIALACAYAGFLEAGRVVHFTIAAVVLNATFLGLIASGANLKRRDPSLTGPQVIAPLLPAVYLMYHVTEPQARLPFVLMAMVAMLFGVLVFDFRRMLVISASFIAAYLLMLVVLLQRAPQRVDLAAEGVIVFAYAAVLVQVAFLGSYIAGLRQSLRKRNRSLEEALVTLRDMAARDTLTRLPNRRALMQQLEREQSRVMRRRPDQASLCVCLMDLDHFKRINDTFGHQVGDAVLCAVAEALTSILRKGDFAGRFGGEEFLIILPESSPAGARQAAERIRSTIGALQVSALPRDHRIQASIGIAAYRPNESVESMLARADAALYGAKEGGRDRVALDEAAGEAEPRT